MLHRFPSADWAMAYSEAINANPKYRTAAKDWTFGAVAIVVKAEPGIGIEDDMACVLDLNEGVCRGVVYGKAVDVVKDTPYVIVADYARWKLVLQAKLEPIKGMMQGKLKLTKGHLPTIVRYVEGSKQLVACAADVPTEFPT